MMLSSDPYTTIDECHHAWNSTFHSLRESLPRGVYGAVYPPLRAHVRETKRSDDVSTNGFRAVTLAPIHIWSSGLVQVDVREGE